MKEERPEPIIKAAEALGGKLVAGINQVADADIVVALSISNLARPKEIVRLVFNFPDKVNREKFRDAVFRSYEDPAIFEPWKIGEYLSEPAGSFFKRFNNGGGTSGSSHAMIACSKRKDG